MQVLVKPSIKINQLLTLNQNPVTVSRVVILGAKGFVASAAHKKLEDSGIPILPLSHSDLDLTNVDAGIHLAGMLQKEDTLLFVSAKAPVKNEQMLLDNIRMAKAVCEAVNVVKVSHLVYISSDAVYSDNDQPLLETSCAEPSSLHGAMHLVREVMLKNAFSGPLCILRPTLIFGAGDPHNGYGPNRFMRLAKAGKNIELFGNGEEQRDHVWIQDVAAIIVMAIENRAKGILNVATGEVISFRTIAEKAVEIFKYNTEVISNTRVGTMPHNGFRPFDSSNTQKSFQGFQYHSLFSIMEKSKNGSW